MKKSLTYVAVALMVATLLSVAPATAKKPEIIESYKANAIEVTGAGSTMVEIHIYGWTTDDSRQEVLDAVKKSTDVDKPNTRIVAQALRGQEKVGYAFMAGRQGYPIRYAKTFDMGNGKRQIVLATDRPVSFEEVYKQSQLGDFDVTLVILNVDENGKGSGVLSLGTELKWNDKEGKIEMTNTSSQPIKLGDVRSVK